MSVPAIGNTLFRLFVTSVFSATAAELAEFQPIGRGLLILGRHVVPTFAILTLKHNIIAWHKFISNFRLQIANFCDLLPFNRQSAIGNRQCFYSITSDTVPAPTVRPPSR